MTCLSAPERKPCAHLACFCSRTAIVILGNVRKSLVGASGKPANWSTWWILDGGDDADSLRAADIKGSLNQAVRTLVDTRICLRPGELAAVRPVITGDGKAMLASNFRETGTRDLSITKAFCHDSL